MLAINLPPGFKSFPHAWLAGQPAAGGGFPFRLGRRTFARPLGTLRRPRGRHAPPDVSRPFRRSPRHRTTPVCALYVFPPQRVVFQRLGSTTARHRAWHKFSGGASGKSSCRLALSDRDVTGGLDEPAQFSRDFGAHPRAIHVNAMDGTRIRHRIRPRKSFRRIICPSRIRRRESTLTRRSLAGRGLFAIVGGHGRHLATSASKRKKTPGLLCPFRKRCARRAGQRRIWQMRGRLGRCQSKVFRGRQVFHLCINSRSLRSNIANVTACLGRWRGCAFPRVV
jgi:hypothetical protein